LLGTSRTDCSQTPTSLPSDLCLTFTAESANRIKHIGLRHHFLRERVDDK